MPSMLLGGAYVQHYNNENLLRGGENIGSGSASRTFPARYMEHPRHHVNKKLKRALALEHDAKPSRLWRHESTRVIQAETDNNMMMNGCCWFQGRPRVLEYKRQYIGEAQTKPISLH